VDIKHEKVFSAASTAKPYPTAEVRIPTIPLPRINFIGCFREKEKALIYDGIFIGLVDYRLGARKNLRVTRRGVFVTRSGGLDPL
jgi:hypothetical protein